MWHCADYVLAAFVVFQLSFLQMKYGTCRRAFCRRKNNVDTFRLNGNIRFLKFTREALENFTT